MSRPSGRRLGVPSVGLYHPLDFVAHRDRPHVAGNVVSMMVGIEFACDRADLVALLLRQAARFGPETGERAGDLLDGTADWDRLALAGESIVEADSGLDLTRRIGALVRGSS